MKVYFTPDAKQAIREKRAWWQANRDKAPTLFLDELRAVLKKLRTGTDDERQRYRVSGGRLVWRTLMPKTKNHIYYQVDMAAQRVDLLLVWNAVGLPPENFPP